MSKVIAVSGSQNTGKTTLLNALAKNDWTIDEFKVSRTVQAEWKLTLKEIVSDAALMIKFQEEIIERKLINDLAIKHDSKNDIVLTERSFADIAAYTKLWVKQNNLNVEEWLKSYVNKCAEYQALVYDRVILLQPSDKITFEHDNNRADKISQDTIAKYIHSLLINFGVEIVILNDADINKRVDKVSRALKFI